MTEYVVKMTVKQLEAAHTACLEYQPPRKVRKWSALSQSIARQRLSVALKFAKVDQRRRRNNALAKRIREQRK